MSTHEQKCDSENDHVSKMKNESKVQKLTCMKKGTIQIKNNSRY
jgi:hypothetical protein